MKRLNRRIIFNSLLSGRFWVHNGCIDPAHSVHFEPQHGGVEGSNELPRPSFGSLSFGEGHFSDDSISFADSASPACMRTSGIVFVSVSRLC